MLTTEMQFQEGKQASGTLVSKGSKIWKGEREGDGVRCCAYVPVSDHPVLLTPDPALRNYAIQNLLRIGLAFLVLVALVWLLAEDWLHRKRTQEGTSRASSLECRRRFRTQRSLDK